MTTEAKDKTDNELIAEFMGETPEKYYDVIHYAFDKYYRGWISQESLDDVKHFPTTSVEGEQLVTKPYDTSWDALMPVVEKIAKDYCYDVYIMADGFHTNHSCTIGTTTDIYAEAEGSWLLESVYTAVVKFIKFHNSKP